MKTFKTTLSVIALSMLSALVACSSGSKSTGGGGGGGNPITVALSGQPTSLTTNATASVTATVTNDSANAGVTWSCAPSGSCGTFNPTSTGSGTATTYTAPGSVPSGGSVTITATSVTDGTKTASATVSITQTTISLADGNYVYSATGSTLTGLFYSVTGVFTVSGGAITGGEQDYTDSTPTSDTHDALNATGSSFTTTADGNLQVTLVTCQGQTCSSVDPVIGGGTGIETFNATLAAGSTCGTAGGPCTAKLVEFDSANAGSGTLELQDSTAAAAGLSGSYVFGATGNPGAENAIAGIFSVSSGTISTTTSVFDLNAGGTLSATQSITAGSVTTPDATGRLQVSMNTNVASLATLAFATYVVDANHARIVEAAGPLSGVAYLQNSAGLTVAGTNYVFGMVGHDGFGALQFAGALSLAQSSSGITGTISYNDDGNGVQPAGTISAGSYIADTTYPGRVTITGVTDGSTNNPNTFNIELYIDGNGNGLAVAMDTTNVLGGNAYLQTGGGSFTAGSFNGTYAMNLTGFDGVNGLEYDAVGPITADGVGALSSTGVDLNWLGSTTLTSGAATSGTFTAAGSGVFTGTLQGLDVSGGTTDTYTFYLVDTTKVVAIEVDGTQLGLGTLDLQQ